jgi:dinuclear metal center YbgI/SA1388 family protein
VRSATVADVVQAMDARFPPRLASDWDAVGLVCGDPHGSVRSVLFAVDPVLAVVDEAMLLGADMVITHHPLFLQGVHSVAATTHAGRVVHTLLTHGIALFAAHTNADHAADGVSDALAAALGLVEVSPLAPLGDEPDLGTGRVGVLPHPMSLDAFADLVAKVLPATHHGVRVAGRLDSQVSTVAVCGGSGDAFLAEAAAVADAYVTSDLRHHRALDHLAGGGCALLDVAHWAGEWPWLPVAARQLADDLAAAGATVITHVSSIPTDPWTAHRGAPTER